MNDADGKPGKFQILRALIDGGWWARLSGKERGVYVSLFHHADGHSLEVKISAARICADVGDTSAGRIGMTISELKRQGLIEQVDAGGGKGHVPTHRLILPPHFAGGRASTQTSTNMVRESTAPKAHQNGPPRRTEMAPKAHQNSPQRRTGTVRHSEYSETENTQKGGVCVLTKGDDGKPVPLVDWLTGGERRIWPSLARQVVGCISESQVRGMWKHVLEKKANDRSAKFASELRSHVAAKQDR